MKTAIVYDWIDKWGGVERVLLTLHEMFPNADWFTSYYDETAAPWAKDLKIRTSFIQRLPKFIKTNRVLSLSFYPYAFESFDFSNYNVVISVSSSFAKSVITKPSTFHICYLLTPTRYFWIDTETYFDSPLKKLGKTRLSHYQKWDQIAAQRPDKIVSISHTVQERVLKYYQRKSEVIYPPFDVKYWQNLKHRTLNIEQKSFMFHVSRYKYFLVVSRLEPYKKVDLAINVFNKLNAPLVIVGKGSMEPRLKRLAKKNVKFFSDVSDKELAQLYKNAEALITPQEEEFGYVSLEAQFFGCPVVAYKKGGVTETVIEGKTGIFFEKQDGRSLSKAVANFGKIAYNLRRSTRTFGPKNVERFNKNKFVEEFMLHVTRSTLHDS